MTAKAMLITGASRGIGAAVARLAAASGWSVAVNYVANARAAEVAHAILWLLSDESSCTKGAILDVSGGR